MHSKVIRGVINWIDYFCSECYYTFSCLSEQNGIFLRSWIFSKWALFLSIDFGMMLPDFLFIFCWHLNFQFNWFPCLMRARFKYWQNHHYSQNRFADFVSKLSLENSSSTDRLLSVAKSSSIIINRALTKYICCIQRSNLLCS